MSEPKPTVRATTMVPSRTALAAATAAGVCSLVAFAASMVVLYEVPQTFAHVRESLVVAWTACAASVLLAVAALVLASRSVLANVALAASVLAVMLSGATHLIQADASAQPAGGAFVD